MSDRLTDNWKSDCEIQATEEANLWQVWYFQGTLPSLQGSGGFNDS